MYLLNELLICWSLDSALHFKEEKMKKISILIAVVLTALIFLNACNDCPLCNIENQCKVREVTITVFNPKLQKLNDSTYLPVPEYSIHSFLFPEDDNSTGTLPNDTRYQQSEKIDLFDLIFNDGTQNLKAVLLSNFPTNERMIGDILVIDADAANGTAVIRVSGEIFKLPNTFMSEDANLFCTQYLPNNQTIITSTKLLLTQYGRGFNYAQNESFSINDIKVYDSQRNEVAIQPPVAIVNNLLALVSGNAVNLSVKTGEVYLYRARNGRVFVFSIANISKGNFDPFKKRITILFTAR